MFFKDAIRGFLAVAVVAGMAACATSPPGPRELLDEHTGVTVSIVGAPIELEHELNGGSVHDFLTLVAIQQDDDGKYAAFMLLYRWAIYYGAPAFTHEAGSGDLQIDVDGQMIELQPLPKLPAGLPGPKELFMPDTSDSAMRAYAIDLETLRRITASHVLLMRLPKESPVGSYTLWHDGRPALGQFVKHLSGS